MVSTSAPTSSVSSIAHNPCASWAVGGAEDGLDQPVELGLQPGIVERHQPRAERFVGLAGEAAARRGHRHPRRPQARIEPVDLGRRGDMDLGGERGQRRIAALLRR